jgi:hypothetical protein
VKAVGKEGYWGIDVVTRARSTPKESEITVDKPTQQHKSEEDVADKGGKRQKE